ncbi:Spherulin-1A [Lachnellula hyalina]|uniref:Spherulin-1A n=1 Tax=Lachnellula hyalina TaxID=1316788 RepID=A0A8H8U0D9_9HELO|nr:Spherulin-1A [Lachnellula hyalina]TVY25946.1 Spherulin-1A [Lachnellula hyalina]
MPKSLMCLQPSTSTIPPCATPTPSLQELQQLLMLAPSEVDREAILLPNPPNACNITFQFVNTTHVPPTGGEIVLASVDKFPALIGTHVSAAIGFVDACGLNVPHSHPRANEFLTVVQGQLIGGLVLESVPDLTGRVNSSVPNPTVPEPVVMANLTQYTGMLFPQGEVHFQFNPTCEPAVFAAAFDNEDAGRVQIANTFFSIRDDEVVSAALGYPESLDARQIGRLRGHIPDSFAELMDSCAKRCHIPSS